MSSAIDCKLGIISSWVTVQRGSRIEPNNLGKTILDGARVLRIGIAYVVFCP